MSDAVGRRRFLGLIPGGMVLAAVWPNAAQSTDPPSPTTGLHAEFPSQEPALVREVVAASHTRLERVRFRVQENRAVSLTIHDPHPLVTAVRKTP